MTTLIIPETSEVLFEATLETEQNDNGLTKGDDTSEGFIKPFLSRQNKVAIGLPFYENLMLKIKDKEMLSHEIKQKIETHDFHFLSLSCSFLPDSECQFTWARFEVELSASPSSEKPIVWDIYPAEVITEIKQTTGIAVNPDFSFKLYNTEASAKLFTINNQREFIVYEPQIFSFGYRRTNVAWDFNSTAAKGIWGDKRDLFLIVMVPKNNQLKGRFKVSANVKKHLTSFKLSVSKREDDVVNKLYKLSK